MIREANTSDIPKINYFLSKFDESFKIKNILSYKKYFFLEDFGFLAFTFLYDRIELDYIFIEPNERNKNNAVILMDFLIEYSLKNKAKNITLEVNVDNISAIKLYEKYGFKKVRIIKKYYKDKDGYLMIRGEL